MRSALLPRPTQTYASSFSAPARTCSHPALVVHREAAVMLPSLLNSTHRPHPPRENGLPVAMVEETSAGSSSHTYYTVKEAEGYHLSIGRPFNLP